MAMATATQQIGLLAPLANPLPDPPEGEPFTNDQWLILMSLMDTVVPSIRRESTASDPLSQLIVPDVKYNAAVDHVKRTLPGAPDSEGLDEYLDERPSENPDFVSLVKRSLIQYAREDARKGLAFVLSALNTRVGSLIMTGYAAPIHRQPLHIRTAIVYGWSQSYLPPLPTVYKSITFMAKNLWLKTSPTFSQIAGFPNAPVPYKPGTHCEYEFLQFPPGDSPEILETDVVVVGSGCGGGVCAKNLAEAGHRVMVVDKSYYYPPKNLPMTEKEAGIHLYENGGIEISDDSSISVVAGSTWGGGGTVNWSASLQTQGFVRKEWAEDRGLKFFGTHEFQTCLDRVCDRMGVSADHIRHNHQNEIILEGSRRLGYHCKPVPQNTNGTEHYCGHCGLGCASTGKHGPIVTWLPDAARSGATFAEGFKVETVIFEDIEGQKTAVGVKGVWTSRNSQGGVDGPLMERTRREVIIKAKKVIVSCGTLWSPVILLNSGLTNYHIGRNLYLHPVNIVGAVYNDDVKPWEGGILTTVCTTFEDLDGHGHGAKLETIVMMPAQFLTAWNWSSGLDYKLDVLKFRRSNGFISITRDRDPGRVYKDAGTGLPRIQYTPSKFDRTHTMEGNIALCRIAYVTGAEEINVCIAGTTRFIRDPDPANPSSAEETDARFDSWLQHLRSVGNAPPGAIFASAHQMGTNRMAVAPDKGVVDPQGQVWGTKGLFVSDASIFPSASGVNPMITNMAISDWISRGISKELNREKVGSASVSARL